jgi:hypothetical protein
MGEVRLRWSGEGLSFDGQVSYGAPITLDAIVTSTQDHEPPWRSRKGDTARSPRRSPVIVGLTRRVRIEPAA